MADFNGQAWGYPQDSASAAYTAAQPQASSFAAPTSSGEYDGLHGAAYASDGASGSGVGGRAAKRKHAMMDESGGDLGDMDSSEGEGDEGGLNDPEIAAAMEAEEAAEAAQAESAGGKSGAVWKKPYTCTYCGAQFKSSLPWRYHVRMKHEPEKTLKCTWEGCNQRFLFDTHLKRHVETRHEGHRPYRCNEGDCKKTFADAHALRKHIAVHKRGKMFCLDDNCNKSFTSEKAREEHMALHDGTAKFKCDACDKVFTKSEQLKSHKQRWHEGPKIKCGSCPEMFHTKGQLSSHIREAHPEDTRKGYTCGVEGCGRNFGSRADFDQHLTDAHHDVARQCEVDGCRSVSYNDESYFQHMIRYHGEADAPEFFQRWKEKRKETYNKNAQRLIQSKKGGVMRANDKQLEKLRKKAERLEKEKLALPPLFDETLEQSLKNMLRDLNVREEESLELAAQAFRVMLADAERRRQWRDARALKQAQEAFRRSPETALSPEANPALAELARSGTAYILGPQGLLPLSALLPKAPPPPPEPPMPPPHAPEHEPLPHDPLHQQLHPALPPAPPSQLPIAPVDPAAPAASQAPAQAQAQAAAAAAGPSGAAAGPPEGALGAPPEGAPAGPSSSAGPAGPAGPAGAAGAAGPGGGAEAGKGAGKAPSLTELTQQLNQPVFLVPAGNAFMPISVPLTPAAVHNAATAQAPVIPNETLERYLAGKFLTRVFLMQVRVPEDPASDKPVLSDELLRYAFAGVFPRHLVPDLRQYVNDHLQIAPPGSWLPVLFVVRDPLPEETEQPKFEALIGPNAAKPKVLNLQQMVYGTTGRPVELSLYFSRLYQKASEGDGEVLAGRPALGFNANEVRTVWRMWTGEDLADVPDQEVLDRWVAVGQMQCPRKYIDAFERGEFYVT
eukprot:tig00001623_g9415.t1